MTTFLLVWYACGWVGISLWCGFVEGINKMTLCMFIGGMLVAPFTLFMGIVAIAGDWFDNFSCPIIWWRKP